MATNNQVNVPLSGSTGTGTFVGSASPTLTGTPLLGASPYSLGIITSWVAYTPTFTGFGTPSSVNFYSRRLGDAIEIQGRFVAGTTTATEARITLGFNGTSANISSDGTIISALSVAGDLIQSVAGANGFYVLIESAVSYMTFGVTGTVRAATTKLNGNDITTGATVSFNAIVPVTTWP